MASRESGHAHIRISPDTKRFAAELRSQLRRINVDHDVDVRPDTDRFDRELRARLQAMRHEVDVDVTADTSRFATEMDAVTAPGRYEANIDVDADTAAANAEIERAARDRTAVIHTRVDGGANRSLGLLHRNLTDIDNRAASATVTLERMGDKGGDALEGLGRSAYGANRSMDTLGRNASSTLRSVTRGSREASESVERFGGAAIRAGGGARRMLTTVGLLGTAVSVLGVGISGLVPVTLSAGAAIGQFAISTGASLGSVALPAVTGLGLAFAALKLSTSGMGAAISGEAAEAEAALAELPPEAQAAARAMRGLRDEFVGFADVVKGDFWGQFNNIGELQSVINPVKNAITTISAELGHATRGLVGFMSAGAGLMATEDLLHGAGRATGQLAQATMNVVEGLISIGGAAGPVYVDMLRGLSGVTAGWSRNLAIMYQTGELQERIRGHVENMAAGWQTFTGAMSTTGGIISGVWHAVEGSGNAAYDAVARVFNRVEAWTNSAAGQSTLRDFFADAQDVAVGLMGTVGQIFDVIGTLAPAMADAFTQFGPGMRELIGGLETGLESLVPHVGGVASAIGTLASALAPVLPLVGELGGSTLTVLVPALQGAASILSTLSPLIEVVTSALAAMPDPIVAIAAAWAAMKFVPGGVLAPITQKTGLLSTAVGKASGAVKSFGRDVAAQKTHFTAMGRSIGTVTAATATLIDKSPALQRAWASYDKGAAATRRFADAHRTAAAAARANAAASTTTFTKITALSQQAGHTFAASTARMGAAASGLAAGGLSAMRSGISSVVGALGGPLVAGLMAATVLIGSEQAAAQSAKQAHEAMAASVRDGAAAQEELRRALAGTNGALGDQSLEIATRIAKGSLAEFTAEGTRTIGVVERMGQATAGFDKAMSNIPGIMSDAGREAANTNARNGELRDAYEQLEETARELGIPMSEVNRVAAEGGPQYQRLSAALREASDSGELAADQLEKARIEVEESAAAAARLPANYEAVASSIDTLADSSSSATDRLNALRTLMDEMGGGKMSQQDALMEAGKYIDEIASSASLAVDPVAGLGDELFGLDGQLKATNPNARALHDEMGNLRDQFWRLSESGVPTEEALAQLQPVMDKLIQDFGLSSEQAARLREQFGLMPERVETALALEGGDQAMQEIGHVWGLLESNPDQKRISIGVVSDEAVTALDALGLQVEKVTGSDGEVKEMYVRANTEEARAKLDEFTFIAAQLGTADINPTVWLDTAPLQFSKAEADAMLADLDYNRPTPEADLIIEKLLGGKSVSMNELAILAGQTSDPQAILRNEELLNKVSQSVGETTRLDGQRPTPIADAKTSSATTKIRGVIDWISRIPFSRTVKIIAEKLGFNSLGGLFGNADGGMFVRPRYVDAPRYADGGRRGLPAYATGDHHDGYRLPTTGPGTHEVDGILGIHADGTPAAWLDAGEWIINRRSSKKYHNELRAINNGTFPKLPGYADGGLADEQREPMTGSNVLKWVDGKTMFGVRPPGGRSLEGAEYVWGGGSPNDWGDCSGAMSIIAGLIRGKWFSETIHRLFTTASQQATLQSMGWNMGPAPRSEGVFELGWYNGGPGGGHTTGTLDGVNLEMGGGRRNGQIGGAAPPASSHANRAWIELPVQAEDVQEFTADDVTEYDPIDTSDLGVYDDSYIGGGTSASRSSGGSTYGGSGSGRPGKEDEYDPLKAETWSDAAGDIAHTTVSGQLKDAFKVLGIPDELPPALRAAQEAREFGEELRNPEGTTGGKSGASGKAEKPRDVEKDREKARELDQRVEYATDELEIARTRRDEVYNRTNSKGEKTATESQKQSADLQVKKAEDKLEEAKREREKFKRELAEASAESAKNGDVARGDAESERGKSITNTAGDEGGDNGGGADSRRDPSDDIVYKPGAGAAQWRPVILAGLTRMGLSSSAANVTEQQIDIESGGDPNAQNNWDINAQRGDPSIGLLQVIRSTMTAMRRLFPEASEGLPDDQRHPLANVVAGLGWAVHRYGGPEKIWPTRAGYATGGRVWGAGGPKDDKIPAMLSNGEYVVNSEATSRNLPILERINAGIPAPPAVLARGDLSPGVTNPKIAPGMRQHFFDGGLVGALGAAGAGLTGLLGAGGAGIAGLLGAGGAGLTGLLGALGLSELLPAGIDIMELIADVGTKVLGAGTTILSGAASGLTGGPAPEGDGTLEGEVVRRLAGAAHSTTGHLANFTREVGGSVVTDLLGAAFVGTPNNAINDMLAMAEGQALTAQNIRAATPSVPNMVSTTTTSDGTTITNWTINASDTREALSAAKLKEWKNQALTYAGGR